ncbi:MULTISPECIES: hypothetical protein [unclassified Brevibacterium]|uniref:hypothetical protein n=1 Tax=unclassified Brevibacterium TaxID=2614124 RepID=UPI0010C7D37B|nr:MULTISPECIES: hypothetical protein [unclassified Brevibacterium]MCK1802966.1 hypothetical protein [Brevibacterium sp. R8603A2]QCP04203.1 hypothetical protein FDF13_01835 [Brevibacterium sp. CS2]
MTENIIENTVPTIEDVTTGAPARAALAEVEQRIALADRAEADVRRRLADGEDVGKRELADLRDEREVLELRAEGLREKAAAADEADVRAVAEAVRAAIAGVPEVPDSDVLAGEIAAEVEALISERLAEAAPLFEAHERYRAAVLRLARSVPQHRLSAYGVGRSERPRFGTDPGTVEDGVSGARLAPVTASTAEFTVRRAVSSAVKLPRR